MTGHSIVYTSRFMPDPNNATKGTTDIMAYDFGTGTLSPTAYTLHTAYGCGNTEQGQLQISPDGSKLAWWRYDQFLAGFDHRRGEIRTLPLSPLRTSVTGSVGIKPISEAGSYGNGMLDFMKNSSDILYSQRGVYTENSTPARYDRNVWKYDPVNLTSLSINPASSPLISYMFGEIKRGIDGNYYIPNMGRGADQVHTYNGASYNGNTNIPDAAYKLASSLPTQVYKTFADPSQELSEYKRSVGAKDYELRDQLGNVRVVISDAKLIESVGTNSAIVDASDNFYPEVKNYTDYYAFGMMMPGRNYQSTVSYRYGFNGKENDNEVKGSGNQQDYGMRIYDTRLGKFLSVDPITKEYPDLTPYQFASNMPIVAIDLDGLEGAIEQPDGRFTTPRDGRLEREVPAKNLDQFTPQGESPNEPFTELAVDVTRTFVEPLYKLGTGEDFDGNKVSTGGRVEAAFDFLGNINRKVVVENRLKLKPQMLKLSKHTQNLI